MKGVEEVGAVVNRNKVVGSLFLLALFGVTIPGIKFTGWLPTAIYVVVVLILLTLEGAYLKVVHATEADTVALAPWDERRVADVINRLHSISFENTDGTKTNLVALFLSLGDELSAGGILDDSFKEQLGKLGGPKLTSLWKKVISHLRGLGIVEVHRLESRGGFSVSGGVVMMGRTEQYVTVTSEKYFLTDFGASVYERLQRTTKETS